MNRVHRKRPLTVLTRTVAVATICAATIGCSKKSAEATKRKELPVSQRKVGDPLGADTLAASGLQLTSSAFAAGSAIPKKYTCDGEDVSPQLSWSGVPEAAKRLLLVVDDPDAPDPNAPKNDWVHWLVYNLPPSVQGLDEAVNPLPTNATAGPNDWKVEGYRGPCPPIGRHRYYFRLYALDTVLDLADPTLANVRTAAQGHLLGKVELVGNYLR